MPVPTRATSGAPGGDAELSEFLLRACHDLRGPLRTVRTHAELLDRNTSAGQGAGSSESVAFLVSGAAAAGAVLDGIADYALALATDASRFRPVPMDVIVRGAMARLSTRLRSSGATVSYDELPNVLGDADRLLQLCEYLVDRALRAGGPNGLRIRISAEAQNGMWLFTVLDNAGAMDAESLKAVFTPFARLHANQRPGPGLATCRAIVERRGGRMWADSDADGGCVFRFTLPAG
jgi:light-regulated signal transduction histidine kinase (bacteriophytochrome)